MLPYGYTHELLDNYDELLEIGFKGLQSLNAVHGTEYVIGSIANIICKILVLDLIEVLLSSQFF